MEKVMCPNVECGGYVYVATLKRRPQFCQYCGGSLVNCDKILHEPKSCPQDVVFDKDTQYGAFIEIVPPGELSIHNTRCFCGTWCLRDVEKVRGTMSGEAKAFIPRDLWAQIEYIVKPPMFTMDPYDQHGTIGWKYSPLQTGSE